MIPYKTTYPKTGWFVMKIVFVGSIYGKQKREEAYKKIISTLLSTKNTIIHEHVSNTTVDKLRSMSPEKSIQFHKDILKKIKDCDIVFSESSHESSSVGFLLSHAIELGRPTVIFYEKNSAPMTIFKTLLDTGKVFLVNYKLPSEIPSLVEEYLEDAQKNMDTRFNFFVSPNIERYLNWITKHEKIPRSVFLRGLIEFHMKGNKEYREE